MIGYLQRVGSFGRDMHLFLIFNLLIYIGTGVFALIYNLYLVELGLREDFIGAFNAVHTLVIAAAALTMGPVINRFGTWYALLGGSVGFILLSFALAFAESPPVLLVLAGLFGVAIAYLATTTMPFIIDWGRRDLRAQMAAITFSLIALAQTIGSLVGGFVPGLVGRMISEPGNSVEGYRWTIIIGTSVGAIALVPLVMMADPRRSKPREDTGTMVRTETKADKRQTRNDMAVFVAVGGIMALGVGMVIPFYNVYLTTLGASAGQVGFIYAAGGAAAAVLGLGAPALATRIGSLRAVFWVRLAIIPAYFALIFFPNLWIAVIAHLMRATSINMGWPLDSTFISELLPPKSRASVFGLRSASWNLLFSVASFAGGAIIVRAGYSWTFAALVVCSSASVALFVGYYSRHPRVRSGEVPTALSPSERARIATKDVAAEMAAAEEALIHPPTAPDGDTTEQTAGTEHSGSGDKRTGQG